MSIGLVQIFESCVVLGMLPCTGPCATHAGDCEFAVVGDAVTAASAIRWDPNSFRMQSG